MMTPSRPKQPTAKDRLKGVLADLMMALLEMGVLEPNA